MWASGATSGFCWDSPQQCLRGVSPSSLSILCHGWGRGWAPSPTPLSGGQKGLQAMGPQKPDNVKRSSSYLGCFLNATCFPGVSSLHGRTLYEGEAHLTENQHVQIHSLSKVVQLPSGRARAESTLPATPPHLWGHSHRCVYLYHFPATVQQLWPGSPPQVPPSTLPQTPWPPLPSSLCS